MGSIQIFGDSLNVTNWFNEVQRRQNYILIPILEEILHLKLGFDLITIFHI